MIKDIDDNDSTKTSSKKSTTKDKGRKTSMKRRLSKRLNISSSSSSSKPGFNRNVSRSAYSKQPDNVSVNLHPLSAINMRHSSYSVPKHLFLGNTSNDLQSLITQASGLSSIPENHSVPNRLKDLPDGKSQKKLVSAQTIDLGSLKKLKKSPNVESDENGDEEDGLVMGKSRSVSDTSGGTESTRRAKFTTNCTIEEDDEDEDTLDITMTKTKNSDSTISKPTVVSETSDGTEKTSIGLFISCDEIRIIVGGG